MKLNPYSIIKRNMPIPALIRRKPPLQGLRGYNGYDRAADLRTDGLLEKWYVDLKSKYALYKVKKILKDKLEKDPPVSEVEKKALLKELFPSGFQNVKLKQSSNVGDCYLIASLQALINKADDKLSLEDFFSSIIRKQKDGSFKVIFPGQNEFPIIVTKEEAEFGQVVPRENSREIIYEHAKPIDADTGFKIIERAYGRLRRQLAIFGLLSKIPKSKMEDTLVLINGGFGNDALHDLTGWKSVFIKKPYKMRRFLDKFAKNPDKYLMTAGTVPERYAPTIFHVIRTNNGDKIVFMDEAREIMTGHAYSLKSVNPEKKEVFLTDPNVPSKEIKVSYKNFLRYFSDIAGVKVPKKSAFQL